MASESERGTVKLPNYLRTLHERDQEKRLIIVLENASLETVKVGQKFELLNCDKHKALAKKQRRDITLCRPDITHQGILERLPDLLSCQKASAAAHIFGHDHCLLMLMDSPLNRAGLLQVYVHTEKNVLIEINPSTRIPRTFDRFCGLMVELLHKFSIRAADGPHKLLKVIKNPIEDHLPTGCVKIGTSFQGKLVDVRDLVPDNAPIVFVVGAMSHGAINVSYTEQSVAVSNYPLSAAITCTKLCSAFEEKWGIV